MKKVLALVLSLVLMLGGSAAALAETAQSIPPLSQISSNRRMWRRRRFAILKLVLLKEVRLLFRFIKLQKQMQKLQ